MTSVTTTTGRVTFPRHLSKLQNGHVYFVCAVTSAESSNHAAPGSRAVQEVCGDGVAIDDTPPTKGSVVICNANGGFLADGDHVLVTWSGFADVETDVTFLPDDVTFHYSVALGKKQQKVIFELHVLLKVMGFFFYIVGQLLEEIGWPVSLSACGYDSVSLCVDRNQLCFAIRQLPGSRGPCWLRASGTKNNVDLCSSQLGVWCYLFRHSQRSEAIIITDIPSGHTEHTDTFDRHFRLVCLLLFLFF